MIPQQTTTKTKMLSVVLLSILRFRLLFVPRLASESPCFPFTSLSLPFLIFFDRQNKSRSFLCSRAYPPLNQ